MSISKERLEEYKRRMQELLESDDTEIAHSDADEILCELLEDLGYSEITEIYYKVDKWYS